MIMEHFPWLLPAWLIGVPFVLGGMELTRINGMVRKERPGPDSGTVARDGGTVARSGY